MAATTTRGADSAARPLRPKARELPFPLSIYQTAVGKKWVMAVTGIILLGFVFVHMLGNLKLYIGVVDHNGALEYDANVYGEWLRQILVPFVPEYGVLWIARIVLLAAALLHIHAMYSLTMMNQASNVRYASKRDWTAATFASRSMRYSGVIVLVYIIFHLADLTLGWVPGYDWEYGKVHENVVASLSNPVVAGFYIIANVLLSVHIFHGAYSMFQSLGVNNPAYNQLRRWFAAGLATVILVGNVSFPIAVLAGIIDLDPAIL